MLLKDTEQFKLINSVDPQAAKRLFTFWGRPEAIWYLNDLIAEAKSDPPPPGYTSAMETAFEELKQEHDRDFPRQEGQPEWHVLTHDPDFIVFNEKFKRLARRLKDLWGGPECPGFINELIHDTRDGKRQGFPMEVAMALFKLSRKHDEAFPEHANKDVDLWGGI